MLNLDKILEEYANKVGGKVIPYTNSQSVIVLPTKHGRFQKVFAQSTQNQIYKFVEFTSKVADHTAEVNLKPLMEESAHFTFSRVIIKNDEIHIAAAVVVDHATEDIIKDMVKEVADVADDLEFKVTGKDEN